MSILLIVIGLVIGTIVGRIVFPKTKTEIVEKIVTKEIKPVDYSEYEEWKTHKDDWINLHNLITDNVIQDDEKFDKIMKVIERELKTTEDGELTPRRHRKR